MTAGIVAVFVGYAIGSYGVILLKGYDVPWSRWINPIDPWSWPKVVPHIPSTQIFPSGA